MSSTRFVSVLLFTGQIDSKSSFFVFVEFFYEKIRLIYAATSGFYPNTYSFKLTPTRVILVGISESY